MGVLLSGPMFSPCSPCASRHPYPSIGEAMRAGHHLPHSLLASSSGAQRALGWRVSVPPHWHKQPHPRAFCPPAGSISGLQVAFGHVSPLWEPFTTWPSAEPLPLLGSAAAFGTAPLSRSLAERCSGAGVLLPFAHQTLAPHRFGEMSWAWSNPTLKTRSTPLAWMGAGTDPTGNLGREGATR